ncbi:uncharacterized protein LOC122261185 [Penaeus japonicus]|uniref:uncharacterized protein LOC122261185 n=1 Tax=Penaeus japonicus TaxID=27405 RepID=UPI001C70E432|nr:uncharacterized protein LOC122261185 [Penaeus japonicus]
MSNFLNEIKHLSVDDTTVMASFDVESLFTNVPVAETTKITIDFTSEESLSKFGLNKKQFESLLNIATKDSVFTFGDHLYTQVDGVAMGSPIGPTYANAFLCHHEKIWLHKCPADFKPIFYKRAFNICSPWYLFDKEMKYLTNYFKVNGYPDNIIFKPESYARNSKSPSLYIHKMKPELNNHLTPT